MNHDDPIVIVSCARTPMGSFQGELKDFTAPELGGVAIKAALERANILSETVSEVFMGCVLPAGQGQAPARQASLHSGIPNSVGCTTLNKMCGSGMKAVMLAHDLLRAHSGDVIVAGGMESMTNAPYLLAKARAGYRLGHGQLIDHLFLDGLEDAYEKGQLMGAFAQITADEYAFTREALDQFAITSLQRAQKATMDGTFAAEIAPMTQVDPKKGTHTTIDKDEGPQRANIEKIPTLRPAFRKDGTITAANSSSISDGAAALVLMRRSTAEQKGLTPLATIIAHCTYAQAPNLFTTAPVGAIKQLLQKTGWSINDVDLFEINEAFAVVTMVAMQELNLPSEKVNIHGGACALGHPIGASGARILVTLLHGLQKRGLSRGIASLCIGGGEATAMALDIA